MGVLKSKHLGPMDGAVEEPDDTMDAEWRGDSEHLFSGCDREGEEDFFQGVRIDEDNDECVRDPREDSEPQDGRHAEDAGEPAEIPDIPDELPNGGGQNGAVPARRRRRFRHPREPSQAERDEHCLSHIPPEDWCEFCNACKGLNFAHKPYGR